MNKPICFPDFIGLHGTWEDRRYLIAEIPSRFSKESNWQGEERCLTKSVKT